MHISTFDRYQQRTSPVHQLDPRVKVVVTVLFIISNVILPDGAWWAFLLAWGFLLLLNRLAQFRFSYLFKRSFIALPFAMAAVTVLFTIPGETLTSWTLGSRTLTITDGGLVRFVSILLRSWLSVQMAILLTAVTQFPDLMHALHHLRVPGVLVSIISFMYRYLLVLVDEAIRLLRWAKQDGFPNYRVFRDDPYLRVLHAEPEMKRLLAELEHEDAEYRREFGRAS